jgi:hypothetical protein
MFCDTLSIADRFCIGAIKLKNKIFIRMQNDKERNWERQTIAKGALLIKKMANSTMSGLVCKNEDVFRETSTKVRSFVRHHRMEELMQSNVKGREEELSRHAITAYLRLNKDERRSRIKNRFEDTLLNQAILGAFSFTKDMVRKIGSKRRRLSTIHCCDERDTREHLIFECKRIKNIRPLHLKRIARTRKRDRGEQLVALGKRTRLIDFLRKARKASVKLKERQKEEDE